ncbi:MAG: hypothetical protein ACRC3B_07120 [Bacteroidia bacterium]
MFLHNTSRFFIILALFFFVGVQTGLMRYVAEMSGCETEMICIFSLDTEESEKSEKDGKETKEAIDDMMPGITQLLSISFIPSNKYSGYLFHKQIISFTGNPASPPPEC